MKIKIITLPEAKHRQKRILESFTTNNLQFEFVDGILFGDCVFTQMDGNHYVNYKDMSFLINEDQTIKNTNRSWIRFGEIAAYLAHYKIWKDFLNSNDDKIIICEDDAFPQSDMTFLNDINYDGVGFVNLQTVTAHNQNKQIMYIPPFVSHFNKFLVKYEKNINILCEGLAAYLLTKIGAQILCSYIEKNGFVGPNDCMITKLAEQNLMPVYSPIELHKCFGLDPETNNISFTHTGSFVDYKSFNKTTLQKKVTNELSIN